MKIPHLFKQDDKGLAIPEVNPELMWAFRGLTLGNVLATIKVDGVRCKVEKEHGTAVIYRQVEGGQYVKCMPNFSSDIPYLEALANTKGGQPETAVYVAYGPDINGNPQNAKVNLLLKIIPAEQPLLLYRTSTGPFLKGPAITAETFYNYMKQELEESDVEGVVFHYEESSCRPTKFCQVTRKDFGFNWPLPKVEHTTPSSIVHDIVVRSKSPISIPCNNKVHKNCQLMECECECHFKG